MSGCNKHNNADVIDPSNDISLLQMSFHNIYKSKTALRRDPQDPIKDLLPVFFTGDAVRDS